MRKLVVVLALAFIPLCLSAVAQEPPGAAAAAPQRTQVPAPVQAPAQAQAEPSPPADERGLLREILQELRGLRLDIRNLQRSLQQQRPAPPPPVPVPSSIKLGGGPTLGRSDANVAIIEFSEFQCPFCKRHFDQTFGKLKETYLDTGKVLYEFRDYPLPMHPQARPAALAARCAGAQGAYWKMHDELFKAQASLGPDLFTSLAKTLQLDVERFQACVADPKQDKALGEEMAATEALGVRGTPHFFVGQVKDGQMVSVRALSGAQPFEAFQAALNALLTPAEGAPSDKR
jgi:protein-disulfide isomerase